MKIKTYILTLMIFTSISFGYAQTNFENVMTKGINLLDSAEGADDLQNAANFFDRIAAKKTNEWLPSYYSALAYIYLNFGDSLSLEQRDAYLAKAMERVENADQISSGNAEILILRGYVNMGKLAADPGSRGPSLSPMVMQQFGKAMKIDPENPRAAIMMARMELGMAQFFGSGNEKPCQLAQLASQLFEKENEEGITPKWGRGMANQMVENCERTAQGESNE